MEKTCIFSYAIASTFLFMATSGATLGIKTDESSLLALKSSISNEPQNVLANNWSSSTPLCSWIGVICSNRYRRVTGLNISGMNLQGIIPPQLGNLSFLVSLNLRNNRFHGRLPEELTNLRRLKFVTLESNNFSGPILSSFSLLPNLQSLYLSHNEFSGPIPASIANVSKLQNLAFNWNFLEGNVPQELCSLHHLQLLNLEANQLTGPIPLCVFNLTALQIIAFTGNNLSGKLPANICDNLPLLEKLLLSINQLDGPIPSSLQKCNQLQILLLRDNKFTGGIPMEIGNLTKLTTLAIGENNLEGEIPREISNLQNLEVFNLDLSGLGGFLPKGIFNISALKMLSLVDNNFIGNLPTNIGHGTPKLQGLYLGMNNFNGFILDSISNASELTRLDLSKNSFTGPIPHSLGNLKGLQLLQVDSNRFRNPSSSELTFLTSLTKCRQLKELVISRNPLTGKLPTSIGNFSTSLEIVFFGGSQITGEIPEQIGNLSSLTKLNLVYNEMTGTIPTSVRGLQKLQELYLLNNSFTGKIPEEICNLENLGMLHLSFNQISGPLPACLGNITSLRYLFLDSNRLNSILPVDIWSVNNLLQFSASSNLLRGHLPPEIGNVKGVTLIDLSMNNLSGNVPTTIGDLKSLINLSLAHNRLEGHVPNSFGNALSLEHLDISHNNLTGVIPKSLEALLYLTYFNASFNGLSGEIPDGGPFVNFTKQSFMYNKALCGASRFQVPPCHFSSHDKKTKKRALYIALYTILGFASVTIALVGLLRLRRHMRRKEATNLTPILPSHVLSHKRISYDELQEATVGFSESNILGTGAFSSVYKGTLRDGLQVAVKVFNTQLDGAFKSFDTECEVLRSIRHRNLTKVISSCTNFDFRALVLEYMPSGSLEKWLHSHNYFLGLLQRLNIVIDVAYALDYLHNGYSVPVVHCDLKPSNVLLNNELVGHVSDFGISKILVAREDIARTKTLATIGYIAPEYGLEGLVSTRSDIYSYGILLMETFTRTKPSDDMFAGELSLKQWIKDSLVSDITRVADSNLLTQEGNFDAKVQCLLSIFQLALECTEEIPALRINIKDAATAMNKIKLQYLTSCGRGL